MKKSLLTLVLLQQAIGVSYAVTNNKDMIDNLPENSDGIVNIQSAGTIDINRIRKENDISHLRDADVQQYADANKVTVDNTKIAQGNDLSDVQVDKQNLGNVRIAKPPVPDYVNDKTLDRQRGTIDLEKITKQYNDVLLDNKSKTGKSDGVSGFEAGRAYLFISATIPKKTLEKLLNDAGKYNVAVFLKGNIGNDPLKFAGTQAFMQTLKIDTPPELFIHPDAFKMFKIDRVPALVVAASDAKDNLDEQGCADLKDYDIVYGDLNIAYNLSKIYENASSPDIKDIARLYMNNINVSEIEKGN